MSFQRLTEMARKCSSKEIGDILNWKTFELTSSDYVYKQTPSECDGTQFYMYTFIYL